MRANLRPRAPGKMGKRSGGLPWPVTRHSLADDGAKATAAHFYLKENGVSQKRRYINKGVPCDGAASRPRERVGTQGELESARFSRMMSAWLMRILRRKRTRPSMRKASASSARMPTPCRPDPLESLEKIVPNGTEIIKGARTDRRENSDASRAGASA